ncbi:MAG: rhodanese-like domain-containing protein [Planctomycetota bacterium]|nr:rhodanese-like domain-containing protein [Planctomycetota bacterium]
MFNTISHQELDALIRQGQLVRLLDVRTPAEFGAAHVAQAINIPLDRVTPDEVKKSCGEGPLYIICQGGTRGAMAAEKLASSGWLEVVNIEGGTGAWIAAGLPVIRGKKAMSLERQVRIAAGFLVLSGVILGFLVHPYAFGLAGFVGAGLMFAGITDTCGMGMILAKMPWNQRSTCC